MVLLNCVMLVSGQLLWKIGLAQISLGSLKEIILAIFNKYIFSGLIIYAIATVYWFYLLKAHDLTKVYPLQSMSYILSLAVGYFILQEKISVNTLIGTLLILVGVSIISIK